jgi:hypothetical protein
MIWGFYGGGYEEFYHLGYNAVYYTENQPRFGGACRLSLQGRRISQARNQHATCFMLVFCSAYFRPWRWRWHVPPKRRLIFHGLHRVICQKTELFKKYMFILLFFLALACELFGREISIRCFLLCFCRARYDLFYYMRLFLHLLIIIKRETFPNTLRDSAISICHCFQRSWIKYFKRRDQTVGSCIVQEIRFY